MEKIIALDDDDEEENEEESKNEGTSGTTIFTLPKLRKLGLIYLGKLKRIYSGNGVMVCVSLQQIHLLGCGELKRFPVSSLACN
ncbi:hypothetical protein Patl1_07288 [Pistacia atlantica]|uniref:Uncharacterized protein n=1 Tax=Pistacia atlantica TaxID=434234 RepID=A0ACC1ADA2_9ROSI|nr:hypothetical protein Patl1_07288 [Pistacia atlantica]